MPDEDLYRTVRLIRRFEERALELVRASEIGSGIHPCIGQEGVAAGVCAALEQGDRILSSHRGHGHLLAKGTDPRRLMAEMAGRSTGIDSGRGSSFHPSDPAAGVVGATGTVGQSAAIAAGVAWALAKSGTDRVVACFFGDGAVSQGALLEGLNLASLWRLPVVYVCANNGYAATLPVETAVAGTIPGRGEAFGIPSTTVDGQDLRTVLAATATAVDRARAGGGPSLIEAKTYRYYGHHTFESSVRLPYRDEAEVAAWKRRDPVDIQGARVSPVDRARIDAEVERVLDDVVAFTLASPRPEPADALEFLYASGPGSRVRPPARSRPCCVPPITSVRAAVVTAWRRTSSIRTPLPGSAVTQVGCDRMSRNRAVVAPDPAAHPASPSRHTPARAFGTASRERPERITRD